MKPFGFTPRQEEEGFAGSGPISGFRFSKSKTGLVSTTRPSTMLGQLEEDRRLPRVGRPLAATRGRRHESGQDAFDAQIDHLGRYAGSQFHLIANWEACSTGSAGTCTPRERPGGSRKSPRRRRIDRLRKRRMGFIR